MEGFQAPIIIISLIKIEIFGKKETKVSSFDNSHKKFVY